MLLKYGSSACGTHIYICIFICFWCEIRLKKIKCKLKKTLIPFEILFPSTKKIMSKEKYVFNVQLEIIDFNCNDIHRASLCYVKRNISLCHMQLIMWQHEINVGTVFSCSFDSVFQPWNLFLKLINHSEGGHPTKTHQFRHLHNVWNPCETLEWSAIHGFHIISNPWVWWSIKL